MNLFRRLWNVIRLLFHARLRKRRNRHPTFDPAAVDGVEILSARSYPVPAFGNLTFPIDDPTVIRSLFDEVEFEYNVDGRELGVKIDAFVFVRRPFGVSKFLIVGDYAYLLPDNAWTEMHEISTAGARLFRTSTTV